MFGKKKVYLFSSLPQGVSKMFWLQFEGALSVKGCDADKTFLAKA